MEKWRAGSAVSLGFGQKRGASISSIRSRCSGKFQRQGGSGCLFNLPVAASLAIQSSEQSASFAVCLLLTYVVGSKRSRRVGIPPFGYFSFNTQTPPQSEQATSFLSRQRSRYTLATGSSGSVLNTDAAAAKSPCLYKA